MGENSEGAEAEGVVETKHVLDLFISVGQSLKIEYIYTTESTCSPDGCSQTESDWTISKLQLKWSGKDNEFNILTI